MATLSDTSSLLLFRVGPVLCCAPSLPVSSIIMPPTSMAHPPGSNTAQPGIFKHGGRIVSSLDLRYKFGVEQDQWITPGRMVITNLAKGSVGFWIDEIIEVMEQPKSGWGPLPPLLPRGIFSRTLLRESDIYLYAEFEALYKIPSHGYLRIYIQQLLEKQQQESATPNITAASAQPANRVVTVSEAVKEPQVQVSTLSTTPGKIQTAPTLKPSLQSTTPPTDRKTKTTTETARKIKTTDHAGTKVGTNPQKPKPATTPAMITRPVTASATPNSDNRHTQQKVQPPTHPASRLTRNKTDISVLKQTNTPDKNTGVVAPLPTEAQTHKPYSNRKTPEGSRSAIGLWLLLLLPILAGSGWWIWSMKSTDQTNPASLKEDPTVSTVSEINHETNNEVHHQNPTKADVEPETSPDISTPAIDTPDTTIVENHDQDTNETPVSTADISNNKNPNDSSETTFNETPTTDQPASEYSATIEKEARGLVITIDAPDEAEVFNSTDNLATKPATTAHAEQTEEPGTEPKRNLASPEENLQPRAIPEKKAVKSEIVHIVVKGDTLWDIAIRYVSNPYRYPELAKLSNIKNPDLIYPGDQVRIIKRNKKPQTSP